MINDIVHPTEIREVDNIKKFDDKVGYFSEKKALRYNFDLREEGSFKISSYDFTGKKTLKDKKYVLNDQYVIQLKDTLVTSKGVVHYGDNSLFLSHYLNHLAFCDFEKVLSIKNFTSNNLGVELLGQGKCFYNHYSESSQVISEPSFLLSSLKDSAYSHFVWDTLPLIFYIKKIQESLGIKLKIILIGDKCDYPSYKLAFLHAFGFKENDFIFKDPCTAFVFKRVFVGGNLSVNNRVITKNGANLLRILRKNYEPKKSGSKPRVVYFDRDDYRSGVRRITNEEILKKKLIDMGVEIMTPGKMSLQEKIDNFSDIDLIVAQYGGGVQNQFLFKDNVVIITLQSDAFFRDILHFTQSVYMQKVISIVGEAKSKRNNSNFTINIDLILEVLLEQLEQMGKK